MATIPNEEKVFMVSNSTNTTYSGSASLKAMQEWYTMQDVIDTVRPYQVFTALLTQSGGDDFVQQTSGPVQKGVTYYIDGGTIGLTDFSNVGGQFQTESTGGYYFIATIDGTPNEYGEASADYNTGAPVVTVLENTIGNVWFTYTGTGIYHVNSDNLFTDYKSFSLMGSRNVDAGDSLGPNSSFVYDSSLIKLYTFDDTFNPQNNNLYITSIEIRVYN
jgi:hypothetical protein